MNDIKRKLKQPFEMIFNRGEIFRFNLRRLHQCEFFLKGRFSPYPKFSTTIAPRKIALAKEIFTWPPDHIANNLLHESVHCFQHGASPWYHPFGVNYIGSKQFRMDAEIEAFAINVKWWITLGKVGLRPPYGPNTRGRLYVRTIIDYFAENYLMPWQRKWFDHKKKDKMKKRLFQVFKDYPN